MGGHITPSLLCRRRLRNSQCRWGLTWYKFYILIDRFNFALSPIKHIQKVNDWYCDAPGLRCCKPYDAVRLPVALTLWRDNIPSVIKWRAMTFSWTVHLFYIAQVFYWCHRMRKKMTKQKTPHLSLYVGTPRHYSSLEEMLYTFLRSI